LKALPDCVFDYFLNTSNKLSKNEITVKNCKLKENNENFHLENLNLLYSLFNLFQLNWVGQLHLDFSHENDNKIKVKLTAAASGYSTPKFCFN
jgi:hypothetical protein